MCNYIDKKWWTSIIALMCASLSFVSFVAKILTGMGMESNL